MLKSKLTEDCDTGSPVGIGTDAWHKGVPGEVGGPRNAVGMLLSKLWLLEKDKAVAVFLRLGLPRGAFFSSLSPKPRNS